MVDTKTLCPECSLDLSNVKKESHVMNHWGVNYNDRDKLRNREAVRRIELIMKMDGVTDK